MSYYLVVEGETDTRTQRRERHRVGGGKTLADARRNAGRVFKRDASVKEIVVESTDDGTIAERIARPATSAAAAAPTKDQT